MKFIILLGAGMLLASVVSAAPALPVPRHETLRGHQDACMAASSFNTFSAQVSCVKALATESEDLGDPSTQLYVLTADKLAKSEISA